MYKNTLTVTKLKDGYMLSYELWNKECGLAHITEFVCHSYEMDLTESQLIRKLFSRLADFLETTTALVLQKDKICG